MSPSLQGLPAELVDRIAGHLWHAYLCDHGGEIKQHYGNCHLRNLRLTCREIHAKTMFRFGSAHFEFINVKLHRQGFSRLERVVQHDQLRIHVREIKLTSERLFDEQDDISALAFANMDFCPSLSEENARFIYGGDLEQRLQQYIAPLENLEKLTLWGPLGTSGDGGRSVKRAWYTIVSAALSVIRTSQIHLKVLEIPGTSIHHSSIRTSILEPISRTPELFDRITSLSLHLTTTGYRTSGWFSDPFERILSKAELLANLSLTMDHTSYCDELMLAISKQSGMLPNLEVFTLAEATLSSETIIGFLDACRNTIRDLSMFMINLRPGHWEDVFDFVRQKLQLRCLHLGVIYECGQVISYESVPKQYQVGSFLPGPVTAVHMEDGIGGNMRGLLAILIDTHEITHTPPMELDEQDLNVDNTEASDGSQDIDDREARPRRHSV